MLKDRRMEVDQKWKREVLTRLTVGANSSLARKAEAKTEKGSIDNVRSLEALIQVGRSHSMLLEL